MILGIGASGVNQAVGLTPVDTADIRSQIDTDGLRCAAINFQQIQLATVIIGLRALW